MKKRKPIRAVIFDFDGTLARLTIDFDLMRRKIAATASALLERDVEPGKTPILEWLEELACDIPDRNLGLELMSRARLIITAMEIDAARDGELFPFTRDLLGELKSEGIPVGIITRNCTPAVTTVFPDIKKFCDVFLAREDAPRVKPHPDHLHKAAAVLKTDPGNILMVGDHFLDIETARNAGAMSAAVAGGRLSEEELARARPDYTAPDCRILIDRLRAGHLL